MTIAYTLAGQYGPYELLSSVDGSLLKNHSVTVYLHGTLTPATLYTDKTMETVAANPTTSDPNGNLTFFTAPQGVDYVPVGQSSASVVVPADPNDPALPFTRSWTATTLTSPWTNLAAYAVASYRITSDGKHVELAGHVTTGTAGTTIFTLPVGFRPITQKELPGTNNASGYSQYVVVTTAGVVQAGALTTDIALDGMTFPLDI